MLFKKIIFIASVTFYLTGCGFQPMLKSDTQAKQPFTLKINGEGYPAYVFRREIEKQLALIPRLSNNTYQVDIKLSGTEEAAAYAQTSAITRMNTTLSAAYTISTKNGNQVSLSNSIVTSYPVIARDEFISRSADVTIKTRAMMSLAQEVALEIVRDIKQDLEKQPKL